MVDLVKQAVEEVLNSKTPVNVVIGKVTKLSPIEIEVSAKLSLTKDFLITTERVTKYETGGITIREGLKVNDSVVLLRVQGGQQFVVLDKVVD